MDYPAAIVFLNNVDHLTSVLSFCQENCIEVVEAEVYGYHCIVLFHTEDLLNVIPFLQLQFGIASYFMVG